MALCHSAGRLLAVTLLAGCPAFAFAAPFSYDYVQGGLGDNDGNSTVFAGISRTIAPSVYALGNIYSVSLDHGDVNYFEGGLGFTKPLDNRTSLFVNGQLLYAEASDHYHGDSNDLGAIGRVGVRLVPAPRVELEGALALSANNLLENDGLGAEISGRYFFTPELSGAVGYSSNTELDGVFASVRYTLR